MRLNKIFAKFRFIIYLLIIGAIMFFVVPQKCLAQADDYPKLANYFTGWDLTDAEIDQLAKWDLVILTPQAKERQPQILKTLRQKNPQIKILVYILMQEINTEQQVVNASPFYQKIYNKVDQNNWWLKTADNQHVNWWPKTWLINAAVSAPKTNDPLHTPRDASEASQNWADFLPQLIYDQFLNTQESGLYPDTWDGVFFDNAWDSVSWLNQPLDTNSDKIADSTAYMDEKWQQGLKQIITNTRNLAPSKIIVVNANSNNYNNLLNGRMKENFPNNVEGGWTGVMNNYLTGSFGFSPQFFIINSNTKNSGNKTDYQNFRYGLTSALLGNGYYSFDYGDQGHANVWWYDEYNLILGKSLTSPKNLLAQSSSQIKPGVWQRDFQNAIVLVNSTTADQKVNLGQEFEKIKGTQDKTTNNGAVVKSVNLKANDGLILLRRIEDIKESAYYNGSFVRVFNQTGDSIRNGFFIYEKQFKGGNMLAKKDINNDGQLEIIVADQSKITVYNLDNKQLNVFYPYGKNYNKGINFALGDFDNDGFWEIVTGTQKGYAPQVKIFNYKGEAQGAGFYAYDKKYLGGVNVAVGDLNANGQKQIITGAGYMGGPMVRIFDKNGKVLSAGFFAYAKTFRGGVNVACGDINGDGKDEIVTGAGYGGSSHVRIFNSKFQPLSAGFWAFGKDSKTGVRVVLNDLDGDGKQEILAATPDTFTTAIKR